MRVVKELPMVPKQYFKKLIILTNVFAKKTQKTPAREISLAEQRRASYLSRKNKP